MEQVTRKSPRDRMIRSAATLFRRNGIEGTSFSDVLEHSKAPRGSIYHHFPQGKAQLAEETTRWAGDFIAAGLTAALDSDDPGAAIARFGSFWLEVLRDSDYADGCPIMAAALEGDRMAGARDAAGAAFARWEAEIAAAVERHGLPPERARSIAMLVIAATEGAIVLSRAQRSTEPLERVLGELEQIVRTVVEESRV
jgi:AcrR family transcriptional regulator